jgi:hypothetical protein
MDTTQDGFNIEEFIAFPEEEPGNAASCQAVLPRMATVQNDEFLSLDQSPALFSPPWSVEEPSKPQFDVAPTTLLEHRNAGEDKLEDDLTGLGLQIESVDLDIQRLKLDKNLWSQTDIRKDHDGLRLLQQKNALELEQHNKSVALKRLQKGNQEPGRNTTQLALPQQGTANFVDWASFQDQNGFMSTSSRFVSRDIPMMNVATYSQSDSGAKR